MWPQKRRFFQYFHFFKLLLWRSRASFLTNPFRSKSGRKDSRAYVTWKRTVFELFWKKYSIGMTGSFFKTASCRRRGYLLLLRSDVACMKHFEKCVLGLPIHHFFFDMHENTLKWNTIWMDCFRPFFSFFWSFVYFLKKFFEATHWSRPKNHDFSENVRLSQLTTKNTKTPKIIEKTWNITTNLEAALWSRPKNHDFQKSHALANWPPQTRKHRKLSKKHEKSRKL